MNETLEYVRLAIVIDCEGWICIFKNGTRNKRGTGLGLQLGVSNTNVLLMNWLAENFKGSVTFKKRKLKNHKPEYMWRIWGNGAMELLKLIRPYMILKGRQADLAIEFQTLMPPKAYNKKLDPLFVARMWSLRDIMNSLNKRGISPATTERDDTSVEIPVKRQSEHSEETGVSTVEISVPVV